MPNDPAPVTETVDHEVTPAADEAPPAELADLAEPAPPAEPAPVAEPSKNYGPAHTGEEVLKVPAQASSGRIEAVAGVFAESVRRVGILERDGETVKWADEFDAAELDGAPGVCVIKTSIAGATGDVLLQVACSTA